MIGIDYNLDWVSRLIKHTVRTMFGDNDIKCRKLKLQTYSQNTFIIDHTFRYFAKDERLYYDIEIYFNGDIDDGNSYLYILYRDDTTKDNIFEDIKCVYEFDNLNSLSYNEFQDRLNEVLRDFKMKYVDREDD